MISQKATLCHLDERIASKNEIAKNKQNTAKPAPALTLRIIKQSEWLVLFLPFP